MSGACTGEPYANRGKSAGADQKCIDTALFGQNHNEPTFGYTAKLFKSRIGVLNMLQRM